MCGVFYMCLRVCLTLAMITQVYNLEGNWIVLTYHAYMHAIWECQREIEVTYIAMAFIPIRGVNDTIERECVCVRWIVHGGLLIATERD